MKPIEFELERTIRAPIEQVFTRLVDIDGYNDWMAGSGTMLKQTRKTPSGPASVGTRVVHHARLMAYGIWRLGRPIWRRLAVKERTITVDALKASFENARRSPQV